MHTVHFECTKHATQLDDSITRFCACSNSSSISRCSSSVFLFSSFSFAARRHTLMVVLWQALKCTMVLSVSQSAFLAGSCTCLLLIISLTFFTSILYWSYPFGQAIVPPSHFLSLSLFSLHSSIHFENPISSTRHHLFFLFPSFFSQFIICQSRACRP